MSSRRLVGKNVGYNVQTIRKACPKLKPGDSAFISKGQTNVVSSVGSTGSALDSNLMRKTTKAEKAGLRTFFQPLIIQCRPSKSSTARFCLDRDRCLLSQTLCTYLIVVGC